MPRCFVRGPSRQYNPVMAWEPWTTESGGDGFVVRELPDGTIMRLPFYVTAPTRHRVLMEFSGSGYGEPHRTFRVGEIAWLSEGLARMALKRGWAVPVEIIES
jgi:hypothetical protein